jgi:pantoate--beta-alanine ligase
MKVASTIKELRTHLEKIHLPPVGFVPTMGALHNGHLFLVNTAIKECPVTAVSIFVNPTQFNDKEDMKNYPRTLDSDLQMLGKILRENDVVFTPATHEIYPEEDKRIFQFGNLDKIMEGLHRPGHFNGVAQVVSRLFEIVKPDIAFFGQKDFQQLSIIRELVRQTGDKVKIVSCPIVRKKDGLAMSSRNQLLEPGIRKNAGIIFRTISSAAGMAKDKNISDIKEFVKVAINQVEGFSFEYFEIVDEVKFMSISSRSDIKRETKYFGCIAVRAGKIRLIDNIEIPLF